MARIAGVDLPNNKRGEIGLTYIFGIGRSSAQKILDKCGIDRNIKVGEWDDSQVAAIRNTINEEYKIEGELRTMHRLLQGNPSSYRTSCTRPEHQEQCPYPQG